MADSELGDATFDCGERSSPLEDRLMGTEYGIKLVSVFTGEDDCLSLGGSCLSLGCALAKAADFPTYEEGSMCVGDFADF